MYLLGSLFRFVPTLNPIHHQICTVVFLLLLLTSQQTVHTTCLLTHLEYIFCSYHLLS